MNETGQPSAPSGGRSATSTGDPIGEDETGESSAKRNLILLLLFASLSIGSWSPIRSYDYFWHLATGRWIFEHRALPFGDPFAVASSRGEWINGEWLFELLTYFVWSAGGHPTVAICRALLIALGFVTIYHLSRRPGQPSPLTLGVTLLCWAAALDRLGTRPSAAGAGCVVVAIAILLRPREETGDELKPSWFHGAGNRALIAYGALSVLWMNLHPSALLAPILAGAVAVGNLLRDRGRGGTLAALRELAFPLVSAAALLLNPHGIHGISAPLHLLELVGSSTMTNVEWLPSDPRLFPLLYLILAGSALLMFSAPMRRDPARAMMFLPLAYLAVRHVRDQALVLVAIPMILAPVLTSKGTFALLGRLLSAIMLIVPLLFVRPGPVIDPTYFPVTATAPLRAHGLKGNIYNADQFGGYLIWLLYPERRALTDGRNELYRELLAEYELARRDSRAWKSMIRKYRLTLALEEYRRDTIEVVDARSGKRVPTPASLVYFPRSHWALIGFDDVAMLFARRDAFSSEALARIEYRTLVPDAPWMVARRGFSPGEVAEEISRAGRELGQSERLVEMAKEVYGK